MALLSESERYGLSRAGGRDVIDYLVASIRDNWDDAAEIARLSPADKRNLRARQILPRAAFFDYEGASL